MGVRPPPSGTAHYDIRVIPMAPGVTLARVNWHSLTRRVTKLRAFFDVIP